MSDIPPGYCQCGCGERTKIVTTTRRTRGLTAGEPRRFVLGHGGNAKKYASESDRQRAQRERDAKRLRNPTRQRTRAMPAQESDAVKLYRETRAERMPIIAKRHARALDAAKRACDEADARLYELRHAGRPKGKPRLLLNVRGNPDALLAAVPQWQGER